MKKKGSVRYVRNMFNNIYFAVSGTVDCIFWLLFLRFLEPETDIDLGLSAAGPSDRGSASTSSADAHTTQPPQPHVVKQVFYNYNCVVN